MLGNKRNFKIEKIAYDHYARLFKHDVISKIHIHFNKLTFCYIILLRFRFQNHLKLWF